MVHCVRRWTLQTDSGPIKDALNDETLSLKRWLASVQGKPSIKQAANLGASANEEVNLPVMQLKDTKYASHTD